ncbi:MAG: Hsp20/alpha crystallin family protein [Candidatus Saccharibacteria bacterium]|nr:Hsp20/alpha crystallin family protein [Candidatus Saccharibacteria bacterium]
MARNNEDDLLIEDDLAAAFLGEDAEVMAPEESVREIEQAVNSENNNDDDEWESADDFPGQLAVDVYETADKLIVKARTAGISKSDLDVSISDNILTISGVLSGGDEDQISHWHIQECYWGEFSRTIALPVQVREDEESVKAELKDGVLTIAFEKEKTEPRIRIPIR